MRIAITTLGCKANQYDSQVIREALKEQDFEIVSFSDEADTYIINTCTVTRKTDYQSRQLIRRAHRANPDAKIIVTGCYAQVAPDEVKELPGVWLVVGNQDKARIARLVADSLLDKKPRVIISPLGDGGTFPSKRIAGFSGRTRFFLKIQDGCNAHCSYCIIPRARGPSRSMHPKAVLATLGDIGSSGYKEVILTGIHLGAYGADLHPPTTLVQLLTHIEEQRPVPRVRLSSIEPNEITEELINLIAGSEVLCPHLHVPIQSGDTSILKRMNRTYSAEDLRPLISQVVSSIPDVAIGVDVIVGFPGEGEHEFGRTFHLLEALPITYLHVFPYSPRKGTPAADLPERVGSAALQGRSELLRALSNHKKESFYTSYLNQSVPILIEGRRDRGAGLLKGLSRNYIPVSIEDSDELVNREVLVRITSVAGTMVRGARAPGRPIN